MAYAVSYDIKFNDQFSKVAKKVLDTLKDVEREMKDASEAAEPLLRNTRKMARAFGTLDKKLRPVTDNIRKFDNHMEDIQSQMRRMVRTNGELAKSFGDVSKRANRASESVKSQMGASLKSAGDRMNSFGRTMSTRVSLPIYGAGIASVKFAADFETAMVEVQKVTDKATAEKLGKSIREMARTDIPLAHNAIAGIAADAARFGIKGADNIENFTRSVAKMSIATDLSAEFAGEAFAKIQAQTGASVAETENLGSAINALSNNYATSASEIVSAVLRSGSAASNFGLTPQQVIAMSAQMNAMSESAERAGTRMRTLFMELQDPSKVANYADAIGMTAAQFDAMRRTNAHETVMMLVEAMGRGGVEANLLAEAAGMEARQALVALSKDMGATRNALMLSNSEWAKNTSLNKEFADASGTANIKARKLWNRIKDISITIGDKLIPILERLIDKYVIPFIEKLEKMDDKQIENIITIGGVVAAIGPLIAAFGGLVSAIGSVQSLLATLNIGKSVAGLGGITGTSFGTAFTGKAAGIIGAMGWIKGALIAALGGIAIGSLINEYLINPAHDAIDQSTYKNANQALAIEKQAYKTTSIAQLNKMAEIVKTQKEKLGSHAGAFVMGRGEDWKRAATTLEGVSRTIEAQKQRLMESGGGMYELKKETLVRSESKTDINIQVSANQGTQVTGIDKKVKSGMPNVNVGSNQR